ncbi:hypothetical protein LguiA_019686 [Lonicera macranthoides]
MGSFVEDCTNTIKDGFGDNCNFNFESKSSYDCGKGSIDKVSQDIVDLLPSDPFSMDISANFKAIIDWIEEFEDDLGLNTLGLGVNFKSKSSYDCRKDYSDMVSEDIIDIVDLLPSDPFSMDISAKFQAIIDWIEEFEDDLGLNTLGLGINETDVKTGDDELCAGFNLIWKGPMRLVDMKTEGKLVGSSMEKESLVDGLCDNSSSVDGNIVEELMGFSYEKYSVNSNIITKEAKGHAKNYCDDDRGDPHDALFFALGYLGIRDLLCVERVCKSLKDAVRTDPLLWKNIYIDRPLSDNITDEALLKLTSRAQGSLQCLSLVRCFKISDNGIKRVLERNPQLTKLSVPGCVRISLEGILCNLKVFNSAGTSGIKHLRTGGMLSVTKRHFEELKFLLGADNQNQPCTHKPRFYHGPHMYLSFDDDRAIDIETCPRCKKVRQVYDCPKESCHSANQLCKACTFCIARCINCGCCIDGHAYEETFCLDLICLDCWKQLLNCQESLVDVISGRHFV